MQARFPTIRGVAVNDSALGRFIDCRNECAKFFRSRFARTPHSPLERTQPCSHTPVVKRTPHRLPGALGCGLCISHWLKGKCLRGLEARGARQSCQDVTEPGEAGQLLRQERVYQHAVAQREGARRGELIDSIGCLLARSGSNLDQDSRFVRAFLGTPPTRSQGHRTASASGRRCRLFGASGRKNCRRRRLVGLEC